MLQLNKSSKIIFSYVVFLFSFSILFNQYYGNLGVCPIDSFASFNAGYDVLNGKYPFKDYWTITGPFIALTQAFLFKLFGVTWSIYVLHASLINFTFTVLTFYTLYKFKLGVHYCFFYSLLVSVLSYPSSGTPYVDHQAAILSIISIYFFVLALKTNRGIYWFILPIILMLSFLTKQAPTGHILIIILFLSLIFFIFNFNIRNILMGLAGSLIIILTFLYTLYIANISFSSFYLQYILFPLSLGEDRLNFLFPLEFNRIILRYKLIHISSAILVIFCVKQIIKDYKFILNKDLLIAFSLIFSSWVLIIHQLMTINGMFIFFIIPVLASFSHIYYSQYFKNKKNILTSLIIFTFISTFYYGYKYVHQRDFMDLRNANMNNTLDANILSRKLNGLNWKSCLRPKDPGNEISELSEVVKIIKEEQREKTVITDYQFISVILSEYDNSPSQVWFQYHVNPQPGSKYFKEYRQFFIDKFEENKVKIVYVVKPMLGGDKFIENVLDSSCYEKNKFNKMLDIYKILDCYESKN